MYSPEVVDRKLTHRVPKRLRRRVRRAQARAENVRRYSAIRVAPTFALTYMIAGREIDNFTYEISNRAELADVLAQALGVEAHDTRALIDELDEDVQFRHDVDALLLGRADRPSTMPFGRRIGWYVATRIQRPRTVVETGVHDGLGSALLLRALARNAESGDDGRLLSFDVRSDVGWLIPAHLRVRHEIYVGNALELIPSCDLSEGVDLFVHDSDHRYEHETAELELILPLCARRAVILSDNVHACDAFVDFCDRQETAAHVFLEAPVRHFYPGAGLGIALVEPMRAVDRSYT